MLLPPDFPLQYPIYLRVCFFEVLTQELEIVSVSHLRARDGIVLLCSGLLSVEN